MDPAGLREICLSFPGAFEDFPFGPETSVFKVRAAVSGGARHEAKMFAASAMDPLHHRRGDALGRHQQRRQCRCKACRIGKRGGNGHGAVDNSGPVQASLAHSLAMMPSTVTPSARAAKFVAMR